MRTKTLIAAAPVLALLIGLAACGQKEDAKPENAAAPGADNGSPAARKADAAGSPRLKPGLKPPKMRRTDFPEENTDRVVINGWLKRVGKRVGLALSLDADGVCSIGHEDGLDCAVEVPEDGAVLLWVDQLDLKPRFHDASKFSLGMYLIIGFAQCLAMIPGVSRSGSTICMILLLGFTRSDAARFSFLLSIPAIAGAGLFEAKDAFRPPGSGAIRSGEARFREGV